MYKIRVFLLLLLVTLLAACGGGPARDESGAVVEEGDESVFDLNVGDCFNDPEESEGLISDLTLLPCDQPHDNEVFALVNHPAGDGEAFPGDEAMDTFAEEQCLSAFEQYVGLPYEESVFAYVPIKPTAETWADGDREVVCVLYDGQLEELEGSVRGSNR
jgi:hypothetical protein